MNTLFAETATSAAVWIVIKASILLGAVALAQLVLGRRTSAASRHALWMVGLASVLALPLVTATMPQWPLEIPVVSKAIEITPIAPLTDSPAAERQTATSAPLVVASTADAPRPVTISWRVIVAGVYGLGVLVLLVFFALQRWSLARFARVSTNVHEPEWTALLSECASTMRISCAVRLLRSRERNVPMAFGTRRPSIVIPSIADTWAEDRRRAVVLHELAHVARHDCLTHIVSAAACAMYWFHPAVWWVARRIRIERELACDDRVIAAGTGPREYAGHLLEIAYSFGGRHAPALAVTMARPRQLEGRMLAALDAARNRRLPTSRVRMAVAATAFIFLVSVAMATPAVVPVAADEPPPTADPWTQAPERPDVAAAVKDVTTQQLKAILSVPQAGLKEARADVRAVATAFGVPQENTPGTWEIRPSETKGMVHLRIVELHSSTGKDVPIAQLEGLTGVQLSGAGGPVQFKVRRDAGTFTFEGVLRNGVGAGTFSFTPDPNFPAELAKRGFARPTALEQYQLARYDVGFAFVDELNRQGYTKPQTADLVRAGQHGVEATYLRDMGALGYRLGTLDPLITLRDHGVTPEYARQMADLGYKGLSAEEIQKARDHGITPEYVRAMRDGGYGSLPLAEIIKARDHGISAEYIRGMRDAGYGSLPLTELINARDHGITPEFVRELASAGYSKLPLDMALRMRDHGVTPEYVRGMKDLGFSMTPDELVRARDHGVTVEYSRELKALGYDKLSVEDLTMLRDQGLTAERIKSANARAGTKLPLDLLKSLAAGGMR